MTSRFPGLGIFIRAALLSQSATLASSNKTISGLTGPAAPVGLAINEMGNIRLGAEFPHIKEAAKYTMRGRYVTVEAGGIVPIHSHRGRPAITYVVKGELVEHRSDEAEPIVRKAGDCTLDINAIAQWWENKTNSQVVLFVVDILDPSKPSEH